MASIYGVQIKNLKPFRDHEGMTIYQGDIWMDGKKLGAWSQSYMGGICDDFDFNTKALDDRAMKYLNCISGYDLEESNPKLFGQDKGIICQQCNCVGAYGAGISGAISKVFRIVEDDFRSQFIMNEGNQFGTHRVIQVGTDLYVANIYSQDKCGYPKPGQKFTDMDKLVVNICEIAENHPELPVYLPHSKNVENDGIGCGLGGGKWSELVKALQKQNLKNVYVLNTLEGKVVENINDVDISKIQEPHKNFWQR